MTVDLLRFAGLETVSNESLPDGSMEIVAELIDKSAPVVCPSCGGNTFYKHGARRNRYADTPIEMRPVSLIIEFPRYRCRQCRAIAIPSLEFLDEKRRATTRLISSIKSICLRKTFRSVAEDTGLALNTVKNIARDHIADLESSTKYETPIIMGIDEVNLAGAYRGIITNISTKSVFEVLEYRTQDVMKPFFKSLPDKERVEWVCTDMWRPFKKSFGKYLPNAKLVIDKFHVVKMASEALEAERKRFQAALEKEPRLFVKKTLRWLVLKRPHSLSDEEKSALDLLKHLVPSLAAAYEFKEWFYRIYDCECKEEAIATFQEWAGSLPVGEFREFHQVAKTVRNHFEDIFAYWDTPFPITNAYTESLNGLAKMANRLGRGYSYDIIRARILYGNLSGAAKGLFNLQG